MPADIYGFLGNFQGGGARANRYEVMLTFPQGIGSTQIAQKLSFTCKATSIPSSTIGEAVAPYKGRQIKFPGDVTFNDWSVTVLIDNDFLGRGIFEKWQNLMLGWESNTVQTGYMAPSKIYGSGTIKQLDREDKVIQTYVVQGMFPKDVSELTLGYDQNDQIMEQQVTFAVNQLKSNSSR